MATAKITTSSGEVTRLTVCGPTSRIELAVPAHVPMADLLPTFLGHLGPEMAMTGLAHDGWVLQRLGEPPLEEDLAAAALGLYDGDVLYLRPRNDQLPPVDFDDLVDGVATAIADRSDSWRPETTYRLLIGLAAAALVLAVIITPEIGTGQNVSAFSAAVAIILLVAATASSRSFDDRLASRLLTVGAIGFVVVAGLALPAGTRRLLAGPGLLTGPGVLTAGAAAGSTTLLAGIALGELEPGFVATALVGVLAALGGLLVAVAGLSDAGSASIVLASALLLAVLVPMAASRLAGLRILPLPTSAAEFQKGIDPEPSAQVLARTARAHAHVTALSLALGVVSLGCLLILGTSTGAADTALTAVASLLLLLHARELIGVRARLALLLPGVAGLGTVMLSRAANGPATSRAAAVLGVLVLGGVLVALARSLPGRRILPHWGRIADLSQSAAAIAIVPLVPAVIGLYAKVRAGWS